MNSIEATQPSLLSTCRVLIADDDLLVARDIRETLTEFGYQVSDVARSADEAITMSREDPPDLALLDIRMPGSRDGVDAGRILMTELDIPVVYLTAYGDDPTLSRAMSMRPYGYVMKPYDGRELHSAIQVALERRRVEARLSESEERMQATLRSIGEAVITTDRTARIRSLNPSAERLLEVSGADVIGRRVDEVVRFRTGQSNDAIPHPILQALSEGKVVELEGGAVLEAMDGDHTPVSDSAAPIVTPEGHLEGGVLVLRDESATRRQEMALRESEARFRQIAERIEDVFWISSPDKNRIDYVSPAYESIWGRTTQELLENPRSWFDQVHPEDRANVEQAMGRQSEPRGYEIEYRIVRPDEEVRWIWDRAFPVPDEDGAISRIVGVAEDVTERVALERRMAQSQKLEAVGQLAGGVAHDFNNLLTVIRSQVDMVLDDLPQDDSLRSDLELVRSSAGRATELTRKLLAFGRDQMLQPRPVGLAHTLRDMGRFLDRLLGESIQIRYDISDGLPAIEIDPGQLEQVIMNLAVNARDAMPEGGTVTLATRLETLSDEDVRDLPDVAPGRYVTLEVSDTGVGMKPPTLERIFDPFFTTKAPGEGTGLGLATVYGVVKQSGGTIDVRSTPGTGTRFTLRFQPSEAEAGDPREPSATKSKAKVAMPTYRLTVVEDDETVGRVTRRVLERAGHEVALFESAEDALAWDGNPPDLVMTDMGLPGMSGPELIRRLRAMRPDLPVVAMSGYARGSLAAGEALQEGVAFLPKPFTPDQVLGAIERAVTLVQR